ALLLGLARPGVAAGPVAESSPAASPGSGYDPIRECPRQSAGAALQPCPAAGARRARAGRGGPGTTPRPPATPRPARVARAKPVLDRRRRGLVRVRRHGLAVQLRERLRDGRDRRRGGAPAARCRTAAGAQAAASGPARRISTLLRLSWGAP